MQSTATSTLTVLSDITPPSPLGSPNVMTVTVELEPGGDVIHHQAANNLSDGHTKFVAVMMCAPGAEMLTFVSSEELEARKHLRFPHTA